MILKQHHRLNNIIITFILTFLLVFPYQGYAQDSFEPDSLMIIRSIEYNGNKITKERIITRELMISVGDTLSKRSLDELLVKSRENLLNTSLFNFVTTDLHTTSAKYTFTDVVFNFTERWYIWPWPTIEFADRNFNTWWSENRDLTRMSYGVLLKWSNFRGRREQLDIKAQFGYSELFGFDYTIPLLNKKETLGLGIGAGYNRRHEVAVMNEDDQLVYYKDDEKYIAQGVGSHISLIYRREIYNTHTFRLEYNFLDFDDTLTEINPYFTPEGNSKLQYFSFVYQFKSDFRDYKAYPLNGYYFDVEVGKRGFGLLDNGEVDVFYVLTTFRKYYHFGGRWYIASGLNTRFSNKERQPFYMEKAIGYGRDIVRGYEHYVVNGQNFAIFKNNFKFALIPRRTFDIGFIRSEKFSKVHYAFYLNAFFDFGFADQIYPMPELNNQLENTLLIGYGLGLDFVTYYDIVLRLEYSFNKMNEHGLYIHFIAPI